jgi:hypothetical protein
MMSVIPYEVTDKLNKECNLITKQYIQQMDEIMATAPDVDPIAKEWWAERRKFYLSGVDSNA